MITIISASKRKKISLLLSVLVMLVIGIALLILFAGNDEQVETVHGVSTDEVPVDRPISDSIPEGDDNEPETVITDSEADTAVSEPLVIDGQITDATPLDTDDKQSEEPRQPKKILEGGSADTPADDVDLGFVSKPVCSYSESSITASDPDHGLADIDVLDSNNAAVEIPDFSLGTTDPLTVNVDQIDLTVIGMVDLEVTNIGGESIVCSLALPATELVETELPPSCNNQIAFYPLHPTFASDPSALGPDSPLGTFSFKSRLRNNGPFDLMDLVSPILTLTRNGKVLGFPESPATTGDILTVPLVGDYSDGILGSGESADILFIIGLEQVASFDFYVDVECNVFGW